MADIVLAGNTSGTLTLSAPDVAGTTTLNLPASSGTILDDASVGVCRAWVNFNGTGTVAIRASFNVSSITDNGVGNYTVNMTNALVDTLYSVVHTVKPQSGGGILSYGVVGGVLTASAYQLVTTNQSASPLDTEYVYVAIFR